MNILRFSNLLHGLATGSEYWKDYHFGYLSDINANFQNVQNPDGSSGRMYPLVMWVAPAEGELTEDERARRLMDGMTVELWFFALQNRNNFGTPVSHLDTLAVQWNDLKRRGMEFYHALRDLSERTENPAKWYRIGSRARYWTDAGLHVDNLLAFGVEFTVSMPYTCADYQVQNPPLDSCADPCPNTQTDDNYA